MANTDTEKKQQSLMQTLGSLQFGLVLLIAVACVSIIGTLLPQGESPAFYREHFSAPVSFLIEIFRFDVTYRSPLFVGLLCLFGVNITLCSVIKFPATFRRAFSPDKTPGKSRIEKMPITVTIKHASLTEVAEHFGKSGFPLRQAGDNQYFGEKGRFGYLGALTVHVSLLLLLAGGVVSLLSSVRGYVLLHEGESTDVAVITETETMPLGFSVKLNNFDVSYYEDHPGRPKDYLSQVTVTLPDGSSFDKDVRVNSPIMLDDLTLYQSSFGQEPSLGGETAANDTALVAVRLKGAPESMPPIVEISMALGDSYTVPGMGDSITVRLAELHRNFRQGGQGMGLNPAMKVDLLVNDETRWSIFAFRNFPGMNMPMYDDIPLAFEMKDIVLSTDEIEKSMGEQSYYTVLGVVKDKGIPFMWIGSIVMTIGLVLSFYLRPRRLWAVESDGEVVIGGSAKGSPDPLRDYVKETAAAFRKSKNS